MEHTRPDMSPEELLERVTLEALSALALGTPDHICDIAPLEAVLPLIAKGWGLPEEALVNKTERLERDKKLVAENSGCSPEENLLECYDGPMITDLLWALLLTAAKLETREERKAVYEAAVLLDKGLSLRDFLLRSGERYAKTLWAKFRSIVRENDPAARAVICKKASAFINLLHKHGLDKTA